AFAPRTAGHAHRDPASQDPRRSAWLVVPERRAASAPPRDAGRDLSQILAFRDRPHRRTLQFLTRPAPVPLPGRTGARRPHPNFMAAAAHRGRPPLALAGRHAREGTRAGRARTRPDCGAEIRAVLPDRPRHRALRTWRGD